VLRMGTLVLEIRAEIGVRGLTKDLGGRESAEAKRRREVVWSHATFAEVVRE